jgi:DNA repair exonuclease SbcCD ATPase subunit
MRHPSIAVLLTLAVALASAPAPAPAQSLGEVAAREKARKDKEAREGKAKRPTRLITDYELRGGSAGGTVSQPAADEAAAAANAPATGATGQAAKAAGAEKTEDELRAERLADWRQRLQEAQADVARLRARVDQVQTSLNDMSGPIYGPNRGVMASQLEQAKTSLTAAEQKVAALEEEGRRNRYR